MPSTGARKGAGKTADIVSNREQDKERQLFSAAIVAVQTGEAKELLPLLQKHPQLPKLKDDFGRTLLHVAASHGSAEACNVLVEEGGAEQLVANEMESKWTPLHCALYKHHLRVAAQLLLAAGANAIALLNGHGSEDKEGFTPLDLLSIVHRPERGSSGALSVDQRRGGDAHCCGSGSNYQLGSGANSDVKVPRRLAALRGYAIVQVATSSRHSLFLTDHGEIFAAGYGRGGRLGTGHEHTQPSPVPVAKLRHVSYIAAGPSGSAAISGDGNLFCWGLSAIGIALEASGAGSTDKSAVLTPSRVLSMREHRVKQVCLAERHLTVLTDTGALYTGGHANTYGQLCSETVAAPSGSPPSTAAQAPVSPVSTASSTEAALRLRRISALADQRIRMIACTGHGGLALLESDVDYCFEWGWGSPTPRKVGLATAAANNRSGNGSSSSNASRGGNGGGGGKHKKKKEERFQNYHRAHKLSLQSVSVGAAACVLSASGEVYSWIPGAAPRGESFTEVRRLELFRSKRVVAVHACEDSNLVLTDFGDLYKWRTTNIPSIPTTATAHHYQSNSSSTIGVHDAGDEAAMLEHEYAAAAVAAVAASQRHTSSHARVLVSARPKLARESALKQVVALANGGSHYHAITALRPLPPNPALVSPPSADGSAVPSLGSLCEQVAAKNMTYESILPTYAFALGYEAEALSTECAEAVLRNLELLLLGVADGTAAPAEFEEYLLDLFESAEAYGEAIAEEESGSSDGLSELGGDSSSAVAREAAIADLKRKLEEAHQDMELLSVLIAAGDSDIQPAQLASVEQGINVMHAKMERLEAFGVHEQKQQQLRNHGNRPAFRHKLASSLLPRDGNSWGASDDHSRTSLPGGEFDAVQLRKQLRGVRKKLAAIAALDAKMRAGELLVLAQLRKLEGKEDLLRQEAALLAEAVAAGVDLEAAPTNGQAKAAESEVDGANADGDRSGDSIEESAAAAPDLDDVAPQQPRGSGNSSGGVGDSRNDEPRTALFMMQSQRLTHGATNDDDDTSDKASHNDRPAPGAAAPRSAGALTEEEEVALAIRSSITEEHTSGMSKKAKKKEKKLAAQKRGGGGEGNAAAGGSSSSSASGMRRVSSGPAWGAAAADVKSPPTSAKTLAAGVRPGAVSVLRKGGNGHGNGGGGGGSADVNLAEIQRSQSSPLPKPKSSHAGSSAGSKAAGADMALVAPTVLSPPTKQQSSSWTTLQQPHHRSPAASGITRSPGTSAACGQKKVCGGGKGPRLDADGREIATLATEQAYSLSTLLGQHKSPSLQPKKTNAWGVVPAPAISPTATPVKPAGKSSSSSDPSAGGNGGAKLTFNAMMQKQTAAAGMKSSGKKTISAITAAAGSSSPDPATSSFAAIQQEESSKAVAVTGGRVGLGWAAVAGPAVADRSLSSGGIVPKRQLFDGNTSVWGSIAQSNTAAESPTASSTQGTIDTQTVSVPYGGTASIGNGDEDEDDDNDDDDDDDDGKLFWDDDDGEEKPASSTATKDRGSTKRQSNEKASRKSSGKSSKLSSQPKKKQPPKQQKHPTKVRNGGDTGGGNGTAKKNSGGSGRAAARGRGRGRGNGADAGRGRGRGGGGCTRGPDHQKSGSRGSSRGGGGRGGGGGAGNTAAPITGPNVAAATVKKKLTADAPAFVPSM